MQKTEKENWKDKWHKIIFLSETRPGKLFDVFLLILILISVVVVMLDSDLQIHNEYGNLLISVEWVVTILFTFEYIIRIVIARKPYKFIFSFYGIIDFLAILPTYLSLFISGSHYLVIVRILRLLRIFRILKLVRFISASHILSLSLRESRYKIMVFLGTVAVIVVVMGSIMYLVEGPENGYSSIPVSIYWAIVTLTTVGYGDIAPQTALGQMIASIIMIMGYAIIAVPTGIITVEMSKQSGTKNLTRICQNCGKSDLRDDDTFCSNCGIRLQGTTTQNEKTE